MIHGFIYIWRDSKRGKFYIGSHKGNPDDGYVGSNKRLKQAYNTRPETFRRKILEIGYFETHKDLIAREQAWLSMIKPDELRVKYYNEKNVATGGNIVGTLTEEGRQSWLSKCLPPLQAGHKRWRENNPEELSDIGRRRRAKVKTPRGGSMPGESNPFYGKNHTEETRAKMRAGQVGKVPNRTKKYVLVFPDGMEETHLGQKSIVEKYCSDMTIGFSKFVNTEKPISSRSRLNKNHKLLGCIIREDGYAFV